MKYFKWRLPLAMAIYIIVAFWDKGNAAISEPKADAEQPDTPADANHAGNAVPAKIPEEPPLNIKQTCPLLDARSRPPSSVHDLRADDISIIMALGDSVSTAYGARDDEDERIARTLASINFSPDQDNDITAEANDDGNAEDTASSSNSGNTKSSNAAGNYMDYGHYERPFADFIGRKEYRGASFVTGGDSAMPSLANFFRHYRRANGGDVIGTSHAVNFVTMCPVLAGATAAQPAAYKADGKRQPEAPSPQLQLCEPDELAYRPSTGGFNAAQTGSSSATLGMQVKYLLRQISKHPHARIESDWKLLNVFIGNVDLCKHSCKTGNADLPSSSTEGAKGDNGSSAEGKAPPALSTAATPPPTLGTVEYFEKKLLAAIQKLHSHLPRTIVNIMQLPDLSQLPFITGRFRQCGSLAVRSQAVLTCPCAFMGDDVGSKAEARAAMSARTMAFNAAIERVALSFHRKRGRDFAVVASPAIRDTFFEHDVPESTLSRVDCLQLSAIGQRRLAASVWRALFASPREKGTSLQTDESLFCPGESSRINTDYF